jgi:hypothetical protein
MSTNTNDYIQVQISNLIPDIDFNLDELKSLINQGGRITEKNLLTYTILISSYFTPLEI